MISHGPHVTLPCCVQRRGPVEPLRPSCPFIQRRVQSLTAAVLAAALTLIAAATSATTVADGSPLAATKLQLQNIPVSAQAATAHVFTVAPTDTIRFSWARAHSGRDASQASCRIVVSAATLTDGVVWDSGVVPHSASTMTYRGPQLNATTNYVWFVSWTDGNGACVRNRARVCVFGI